MKTYKILIQLDNSYEISETISALNIHSAISQIRKYVKQQYKPESIWIMDIKRIL